MGYGRLARGHKRRVATAIGAWASRRVFGVKRQRTNTRVAHRARGGRTRTSTKRRKGRRGVTGPVAGSDSSSFSRRFRNKFVSRKCLVGGKQYLVVNTSLGIQATAGRQGVTDFNASNVGCGTDLANVWNQMAGHTNMIAGGANSTVLAQNNGSAKVFMHSMTSQYIFTNTSNVGVWLTIYDTVARHEGPSVDTLGDSGPALAMSLGLTEEDFGAANLQNTVNNTPFMSHDFCTNFKVLAVKKVYINPGHIHKHFMSISINKWLSADDISTVSLAGGTGVVAYQNQLKNWTYWPLITFYGSPIHSLSAPTTVSVPAVQLDTVITRRYCWQTYQTNFSQYLISTDLPTNIADPHTVPEDQGTDAAVVQN